MRIRGAALGLVALAAAGCSPSGAGGATGGGGRAGLVAPMEQPTLPGRMGGSVLSGTQGGDAPLGPSTMQTGQQQVRTGRSGLSLDGTLPARLVRPGGQQQGGPQQGGQPQDTQARQGFPRARMGGDVAYIPGVPDRWGNGLSARNGQGGRNWGGAYVPSTDFTDPEVSSGMGGFAAQGPQAQQGGAGVQGSPSGQVGAGTQQGSVGGQTQGGMNRQ